jgi:hypothetical protein
MDLNHIDMPDNKQMKNCLGINGSRNNPPHVNMDYVQPVFDLSGGGCGYGSPVQSPTRADFGNFVCSWHYNYDLEGLGGLYVPLLLVRGLMESGYDTADTSPDWGYIGWIPQGKLFVPYALDWDLVFDGNGEQIVKNKTVCVKLYLYTSDLLRAEGVRWTQQCQQFPLLYGNSIYRNGTYGGRGIVEMDARGLAVSMTGAQYFPAVPPAADGANWAIGNITWAAGEGSTFSGRIGQTVVMERFKLAMLPVNCGIGMWIGFDNILADEEIFPEGTTFNAKASGFFYDNYAATPSFMM